MALFLRSSLAAGAARKVYFEGLTEAEADSIARRPPGEGTGRDGVIAVEVASVRRHYGVLAVDERGGVFSSQSQGTLETYARLAAAALDAADAMEEARHQANTAQVPVGSGDFAGGDREHRGDGVEGRPGGT